MALLERAREEYQRQWFAPTEWESHFQLLDQCSNPNQRLSCKFVKMGLSCESCWKLTVSRRRLQEPNCTGRATVHLLRLETRLDFDAVKDLVWRQQKLATWRTVSNFAGNLPGQTRQSLVWGTGAREYGSRTRLRLEFPILCIAIARTSPHHGEFWRGHVLRSFVDGKQAAKSRVSPATLPK